MAFVKKDMLKSLQVGEKVFVDAGRGFKGTISKIHENGADIEGPRTGSAVLVANVHSGVLYLLVIGRGMPRSEGAVRSISRVNPRGVSKMRSRYKASKRRNPEGWHEYLTGGVKNWSKTLSSGAKVVITEPWKGGWSMYQINYHAPGKSYGSEHFANADTLVEAFDAGRRAVKHYEAKKRNPATSDAKVIKAFTEQKSASSKKLHTDGRRLDGLWMGGSGIAVWEAGKIQLPDLGSKAAQSVQKAVAKEAPRSWIGAGSEWALPRRHNPLSGTYAVTHANPAKSASAKQKIAKALGVPSSVIWRRTRGVHGTGWYYLPFGGSEVFLGSNAQDIVKSHRRHNPFGGPLTITHDGPDLLITHKANPSARGAASNKNLDYIQEVARSSGYAFGKLTANASTFRELKRAFRSGMSVSQGVAVVRQILG